MGEHPFTPQQRELLAVAQRLGREKFAPRAARWDEEASFPFENYADLREAGFLGLCVPREQGGLGADYAYRLLVATPVLALARAVTWFDREVLDSWVRGAGAGARLLGQGTEFLTPRRATPALGLVLAGVLVLGAIGVLTT